MGMGRECVQTHPIERSERIGPVVGGHRPAVVVGFMRPVEAVTSTCERARDGVTRCAAAPSRHRPPASGGGPM